LRTFQVVFPKMSVWYFTNYPTHYCLLIGSPGDLEVDYEALVRTMRLDGVAEDLREIGLADPDKLIASFVCDDRSLTDILAGYPLNTEDRPLLEFEAPRYGYNPAPVFENMNPLYQRGNDVLPLVRNAPPAVRERIAAMQRANPVIFLGHHEYRMHNWFRAYEQYAAAKLLTPDDASLDDLLLFDEMERNIAAGRERPNLNTLWLAHALAQIRIRQGLHSQAVTMAAHFTTFIPSPPSEDPEVLALGSALNMTLAEAYLRAGNTRRAREYYDRASSYRAQRESWEEFTARIAAAP
jgi:hypothetical protein